MMSTAPAIAPSAAPRAGLAPAEVESPPPRNAVDRFIRRFHYTAYMLAFGALYAFAALALGLALAPALWIVEQGNLLANGLSPWLAWPVRGTAWAAGFFAFGFSLLLVVPIFNAVLPTRVRPFKGGYFTLAALPWYLHNGLFYLVRYTFLPFVTLNPFGVWFLRAMGMRIGKRSFINTEYISDPCLLSLGDDVALGGSVRIFAHYGGGGHLVIAPVRVGDGATIGLGATVMGDVEVGPRATVLPHSVLLPGSRVGADETWGGVPAQRITPEAMDQIKDSIREYSRAATGRRSRRG
jgi:acetyltransferase-like isoleucine patch superfamily enzyme